MSRALQHVADVATIAGRLLTLERASRRSMTVQERADARTWYVCQRLKLERIAVEADVHPDAVIHAAATLSPATSWAVVMRDLPRFLADVRAGDPCPPFATYGRQRILAALIVRYWGGGNGDGATGPKVRPFALALLGDSSQVVVDRHVARYSLALPDRITVTARERRAIQDAHRVAGSALGIRPRDLQSLLWVARVGYGGVYGDPGREGPEGTVEAIEEGVSP